MAKSVKRKPKKQPPPKTKKKRVLKVKPDRAASVTELLPPLAIGPASAVLDRLFAVVLDRRTVDPEVSHSARLMSRGIAKVAQKFGEEAVECLIEAVSGNREALVAESADVLYHLIVLWVASGVHAEQVWAELKRREGISGIAEKANRARKLPVVHGLQTTKIP